MKILFVLFFIIINCSAFAETLFNTTIQNACANVYDNKMRFESVFTPTVYNCSVGSFLPANGISCAQCPTGWTCAGGEYEFNENIAQGIVFNNTVNTNISNTCSTNIRFFEPQWAPSVYNCSAGYYLPADEISCAECLENNYCPGGNLTFNETTPQGLNPCPNDTPYSPAASTSVDQCYKIINLNWYLDENATTPLTVQPAAQKCIYGQPIILPDTNPTKPGYVFSGWRLRTNNNSN